MRLFDNSQQCRVSMRTTASIVLCLLLTQLLLPVVPVSANLVDAGQTENINEKVVAWEQMNDGKILMVTGSGMLSVNSFEAGQHTEVWGLDLNVTANSATIDAGENLVAVAHNSGVVIVQISQGRVGYLVIEERLYAVQPGGDAGEGLHCAAVLLWSVVSLCVVGIDGRSA